MSTYDDILEEYRRRKNGEANGTPDPSSKTAQTTGGSSYDDIAAEYQRIRGGGQTASTTVPEEQTVQPVSQRPTPSPLRDPGNRLARVQDDITQQQAQTPQKSFASDPFGFLFAQPKQAQQQEEQAKQPGDPTAEAGRGKTLPGGQRMETIDPGRLTQESGAEDYAAEKRTQEDLERYRRERQPEYKELDNRLASGELDSQASEVERNRLDEKYGVKSPGTAWEIWEMRHDQSLHAESRVEDYGRMIEHEQDAITRLQWEMNEQAFDPAKEPEYRQRIQEHEQRIQELRSEQLENIKFQLKDKQEAAAREQEAFNNLSPEEQHYVTRNVFEKTWDAIKGGSIKALTGLSSGFDAIINFAIGDDGLLDTLSGGEWSNFLEGGVNNIFGANVHGNPYTELVYKPNRQTAAAWNAKADRIIGPDAGVQLAANATSAVEIMLPYILLNAYLSSAAAASTPSAAASAMRYTAATNTATSSYELLSLQFTHASLELAGNVSAQYTFMQEFGNGLLEAEADGADKKQAALYALYTATLNTIIEYSGGVEGVNAELSRNPYSALSPREMVSTIFHEDLEELAQGFVGDAFKAVYQEVNYLSGDDPVISKDKIVETLINTTIATPFITLAQVGVTHGFARVSARVDARNQRAANQIISTLDEAAARDQASENQESDAELIRALEEIGSNRRLSRVFEEMYKTSPQEAIESIRQTQAAAEAPAGTPSVSPGADSSLTEGATGEEERSSGTPTPTNPVRPQEAAGAPVAQGGTETAAQAAETPTAQAPVLNSSEGATAETQEAAEKQTAEQPPELNQGESAEQNHKKAQFQLIQQNHPNTSSTEYTWIDSVDDIKTFDEAFAGQRGNVTPDFTAEMIDEARRTGKITVYSSHRFLTRPGTFVTPSKMLAQDYAGGGKVYAKTVDVNDIAWIDEEQGQYAKVAPVQQQPGQDSAQERAGQAAAPTAQTQESQETQSVETGTEERIATPPSEARNDSAEAQADREAERIWNKAHPYGPTLADIWEADKSSVFSTYVQALGVDLDMDNPVVSQAYSVANDLVAHNGLPGRGPVSPYAAAAALKEYLDGHTDKDAGYMAARAYQIERERAGQAAAPTAQTAAETETPSVSPAADSSLGEGATGETGLVPRDPSAALRSAQDDTPGETGDGRIATEPPAPRNDASGQKRSKTESHTEQNIAGKLGGEQDAVYYTPKSERESLTNAINRVNSDFNGEVQRLSDKPMWTGEDIDTALTIYGFLQMDGVRTGDFSAAQAWGRLVSARGTESGRALQAFSKWTRTGAAAAAETANRLEEAAKSPTGKKNGLTEEKAQEITNDVYGFAQRFDSIEDGDLKSIRELIKDQAKYRNTGTFLPKDFGRLLNQINDFDWLKEYAIRQMMNIPADYTESADFGQQLKTWQVNSQLSRLGTFFRNFGGNGVFGVQDTLSQDFFGVALDSLVSKFTGKRTVTVDKGWFSSDARKGARDGLVRSLLEVAGDVDMGDGGSRYGTNANRTFKMTSEHAFSRFMSRWEQLMGYSLTSSDRFFRGAIEAEQRRGLEKLGLSEEEIDALAANMADYRLFQNQGWAYGLAKGAHDLLNLVGVGGKVNKTSQGRQGGFGAGDLLMPYPGVPANLGVKLLEYSPANIAKGAVQLFNLWRDVKKGVDWDVTRQQNAVMNVARGLSGTGLTALLVALFKAGLVRNGDDDDKDAAALAKAEGRQGVQINLSAGLRWLSGGSAEWQDGDELMKIDWLEPMNAFMSVASMIADEDNGDLSLGSMGKTYYNGLLQSVLDMPVMENFQNAVDAYNYAKGDDVGEKMGNAAISLGSSALTGMIPAPVSQTARAMDPYYRETAGDSAGDTALRLLMNAIPGLRQQLPEKLDNFGNPMEQASSAYDRFMNSFVRPGAISDYKLPDMYKALDELHERSGEAVYPDRKPPKNFSVGGEKLELTQEERQRYQEVYGNAAERLYSQILLGDEYKNLGDAEKLWLLDQAQDYATYTARRSIVQSRGGTMKPDNTWEGAEAVARTGVQIPDYLLGRKQADTDGSGGTPSNQEVYNWLLGSDYSDRQQEAIWEATKGSSTKSWDEYRDTNPVTYLMNAGLSQKGAQRMYAQINTDGRPDLTQRELYQYYLAHPEAEELIREYWDNQRGFSQSWDKKKRNPDKDWTD